MTFFDSDLGPYGGISLDELRVYNEVVLQAGELAEALQSHEPVATDRFYRVSDPRIMELVDIPTELSYLVAEQHPEAVTFHSTIHHKDQQTYVTSDVGIELKDNITVHTNLHDGAYVLLFEDDEMQPIPADAHSVSNLIARIAHPMHDPEFSDFKDINDPSRAEEICETLGNNELVDSVVDHTYIVDDSHQVVTQLKNGNVTSCEITELREDGELPVSLTIEFSHYATASNLFQVTEDGSRILIMDSGDMTRFNDIITGLLNHVRPDKLVTIEEDGDDDFAYLDEETDTNDR